jgi:hypothetical protein
MPGEDEALLPSRAWAGLITRIRVTFDPRPLLA